MPSLPCVGWLRGDSVVAVRRVHRFTNHACEPAHPVGAGWEDDFRRAEHPGFDGPRIAFEENLAALQGLDAGPLAFACDPRVDAETRGNALGAVKGVLRENGLAAEH